MTSEAVAAMQAATDPADVLSEDFRPYALTIHRTGKLQDVKVQPPTTYRTNKESLVQSMYKTLRSLEKVPEGTGYFCALDHGITYDMTFTGVGEKALHFKAGSAGCRFVHLDDRTTLRQDDTFRQELMDVTGMNEEQVAGVPGAFD